MNMSVSSQHPEADQNQPLSHHQNQNSVWQANCELKLTDILDGILGPILITDSSARYVEANAAACELLGLSKSEICHYCIPDFTEPSFDFDRLWVDFLDTGSSRGELRLIRLDGQVREVKYVMKANVFPDHHVSLLQDITLRKKADQDQHQHAHKADLLATLTRKVRQSLEPVEVLQTTVSEVRQILQVDRVVIYQFLPDWSGEFVVESVVEPRFSILGQTLKDECFSERYLEPYRRGRVRAISNVWISNLQSCHIELLQRYDIQANLVVPILNQDQLWGLLIAHHCQAPRSWTEFEMDLLRSLADQVGVAVRQAALYDQVRQFNLTLEAQVADRTHSLQHALELETLLKDAIDQVRDSLNEETILQTVVKQLALGLKLSSCNVGFYNQDQTAYQICYEYTISGSSAQGQSVNVADHLDAFQAISHGNLIYHTWNHPFRGWITAISCPIRDQQELMGILQLIRPLEQDFSEAELRFANQVANQCAIAIRQARLYQAAQVQIRELERLNQLKDDFLSTVSHELRTPLTNIRMAAQMLKVGQLNRKQQQYLGVLEQECSREINLINDLLDLQRVEATPELPAAEWIDLRVWSDHLIRSFELQAKENQQQLQCRIEGEMSRFATVRSHLDRILHELLTNACKYTSPGGSIEIQIECLSKPINSYSTKQELVVTVKNSGSLPQTELSRLFDKFYRVPQGDPWRRGGTGLGLALVKGLVLQLGGTIEASSSPSWIQFQLHLPEIPPPARSGYGRISSLGASKAGPGS